MGDLEGYFSKLDTPRSIRDREAGNKFEHWANEKVQEAGFFIGNEIIEDRSKNAYLESTRGVEFKYSRVFRNHDYFILQKMNRMEGTNWGLNGGIHGRTNPKRKPHPYLILGDFSGFYIFDSSELEIKVLLNKYKIREDPKSTVRGYCVPHNDLSNVKHTYIAVLGAKKPKVSDFKKHSEWIKNVHT